MKRLFPSLLILFAMISTVFAQDIQILRHPSISPNGDMITFSYQGDIWVVSSNGGQANRLTIHESYEALPRWSPDGSMIAFQGNRHGNNDIFVVDRNGSTLERKTFHSASDGSVQWGPDGDLWFSTRRAWAQVEREAEIYRLEEGQATPYRAMGALGLKPIPSQDGRFVALEMGTCRTSRERYRGPANRDIWIYNRRDESYTQLTDDEGQDYMADWGAEGQLYFLSARNGRYNIHSMAVDRSGNKQGDPVAITNFIDEGIRHYDVNGQGDIVFARGTDIFIQKNGVSSPRKVNISVGSDFRFYPVEKKSMSNGLSEYAVSPNEKNIALVVRGEIFITANDKEKNRTVRLTNEASREGGITWLNDTTLLFISDRKGQKDIFKLESADPSETDLFRSLKHKVTPLSNTPEDENRIVLSHERDRIAIIKGRGGLVVADIDSTGAIGSGKTLLSGWDYPGSLSWSPDDEWLAYSLDDLDFNSEVYIHKADGTKDPVNVSMHPRRDNQPVWSEDGSKLGFVSQRNNADSDIWFVWLKDEDWQKTKYDWEEEDENGSDDKKKSKKGKDKKEDEEEEKEKIVIDFEDIHRRVVQVTREAGNEGSLLISKDGETFYFTTSTSSGRALKMIKWNREDEKTVLQKASVRAMSWDKAGKMIYHIGSRGSMSVLNTGSSKTESRPFRAKLTIDHEEENKQIFDEGWRALRDGFYDPDYHGQDWDWLRKKYRPRVIAASTKQDFRDLFNEMLGQLNASHMGMYGSNPEETQRDNTGYLGIEIDPDKDGAVVSRIIPNTPADREVSKLEVGDRILAVNGEPVLADVNIWQMLDETRNEKIYLQVMDEDKTEREVVIRPTSSIRGQLYESWVEERRKLTERYSGGRLGYIHIQGMSMPSFEVFERELMASGHGKEGIVIDVRYNGGGWTTDYLMAVLNTRQHAYTIPRGATNSLNNHRNFKNNYPFGERLPFPHLKIPSIALCNENSYSNAEIFSHAYKTLDHGTLVGQPTFGAVISTGSAGLIDGSYVRMPFRAWYVHATEENMELGPAVPDLIVEDPPQAKEKGEDPQLKAAVEKLLEEIAEK